MTKRAAMILAAGFGTRMGALTKDRPKPLIPVAGRALISHAIQAAGPAAPILTNGHYRAAQLQSYLDDHHSDVLFSHETPEILDSAGGIKQALPQLGTDPILTLNADAVWRGPVPHLVLDQAWDADHMDALLLLVPRSRAVGRVRGGDFARNAQGHLSWDRSPEGLVYTGAQILKTDLIAAHPARAFSLLEIWQTMMDRGRLFGCFYPGHWADVGHAEGVVQAEAMVADAF